MERPRLVDACRACLSNGGRMFSISKVEDAFATSVMEMLMSFTSIVIAEGDGYPQLICSKCTSDAVCAYSFKMKCEESDKALRNAIRSNEDDGSFKIEIDDNDSFLFNDRDLSSPRPEIILFCENDISKSTELTKESFELETSIDREDKKLFKNSIGSDHKIDDEGAKLKRTKKKRGSNILSTNRALKKLYECIGCRAIFKSKHTLRKHFSTVHGRSDLRKRDLKILFEKSRGQKNGSAISGNIDKSLYYCDACEFNCKIFGDLKKHIKSHTGDKPILCDECDYRCSDVGSLVKHKRKHSGDKPFECESCPYRTGTAYALRTHAATHTQVRPYACNLCEFTCKLRASLAQHIARRHDRRRDYTCGTCGKRFFSASHRNVHMRVHTGERPYSCDKCGTAFSQKSNLEKHVSLIHNDSPKTFSCSACDYVARSIYTLKNHEKKHSGERPMKCDMCDYSCITSSALKLHRQRHVGDARYNCDICDYKCYTAGRLKAHTRKHTGERPYPCDLCDYRAKTDSGLRNHKVSHNNEQKYACANCPYKTNYRSNLTKHELKLCGRMAKNSVNFSSKV